MQKRMETAVKRTSDRIIPVAMPKYQRGQEIQWQWPKIRLPPIDCPLSAAFWPSAKAIFWKSFQLSGRRPIENKNPPLPPVPVLSRPNGRGRTQWKKFLCSAYRWGRWWSSSSSPNGLVDTAVTLFPHSGARPSFPFKYGNRTNAKEPCRPQPSTLYLASDRLRPESWPRKKKLEQFSSVRLELKSPNLLITKAFQFFPSNKKIIFVVLRRCNTGRPVLPPFRWIAPISEPFLSVGELF